MKKSIASNTMNFSLYRNRQMCDFQPQWSESHTSYELRSLSINIIYKLLLKFNGSMENFVIL